LRSGENTFLAIHTRYGLAPASAAAAALGLDPIPVATMRALIESGEAGLEAVRATERAVNEGDARVDRAILIDSNSASFAPPVPRPPKIVCVGQNYMDHCLEQGKQPPDRPVLFAKFATALIGHRETIRIPREVTTDIDYEAELAFVIGREGKNIEETEALDHVFGYTCTNDVSARDVQRTDGQWLRAKTFDTFGPCGPYLVTREEIANPQALKIRCEIDGTVMQDSNTSNLIFGVAYLIAFMSRCFTLEPGDLVTTGTPPGVGAFRKPPCWLKPGETVSVEIEGIGRLTNPVE